MRVLLLVLLAGFAAGCDNLTAPSNDQIPCALGYHNVTEHGVSSCVPR